MNWLDVRPTDWVELGELIWRDASVGVTPTEIRQSLEFAITQDEATAKVHQPKAKPEPRKGRKSA